MGGYAGSELASSWVTNMCHINLFKTPKPQVGNEYKLVYHNAYTLLPSTTRGLP